MLLRDVLKVVGESELKSFPWGRSVISLVNGFVDEARQLTLSSTGTDIVLAIESINEMEREMVLSAKVSADGFIAPPTPSANDDVQTERKQSNSKSIALFMFVGTLCLIALIMTLSASYAHLEGRPMDTSGVEMVLNAILEALKSN